MDDASLVRSLDAFEQLSEPDGGRLRIKPARALEFRAQRRSAHKLHHQIGSVGPDAAIVIDADDVRMIQAGRSLRLALETPQRRPVAEHVAEHDLDRNPAIETQIRRFVNRAHPAPAYQLLQAIFLVYR